MRLTSYLHSVESLATAATLSRPIAGDLQSDDLVGRVLVDLDQIVLLRDGDGIVGYTVGVELFNAICAHIEETIERRTLRDIMQPIVPQQIVEPEITIAALLELIEARGFDLFLVGNHDKVHGFLRISELLAPPALIYYLCLSLEVEAAALELCALYPRAFFTLKESRRERAVGEYQKCKKERFKSLVETLDEAEMVPHKELLTRELLLTTMMCDKRDMLLNADLGLTQSKAKIRRVFSFCERVRNYVAHPAARFTYDYYEGERIATANHEQISDNNAWTIPVAVPIAEELGVTIGDIAKAVRECRDLIADIDRAQSVAG